MSKSITVIPFGGLGNRLRVLNSALEIANINPIHINLVWLKKKELNASFHEIFIDCGQEISFVSNLKYRFYLLFAKHIFINKYEIIYRFFFSMFFDLVLFDSDIKKFSRLEILRKIEIHNKILIASCYDFYPIDNFNNFIVKKKIRDKIPLIPENTIGLHVRRTDHAAIIQESPNEVYFKKIKEMPLNSKYYLATDEIETISAFRAFLGNKLLVTEGVRNRNTQQGIEDAIIDIYALAQCKFLIGNPKSSFIQLAQKIGRTKEIIEV